MLTDTAPLLLQPPTAALPQEPNPAHTTPARPRGDRGDSHHFIPPSKASCEAAASHRAAVGTGSAGGPGGTGKDRLFAWPLQLELLKLSSAQAGFFCALEQRKGMAPAPTPYIKYKLGNF